MRAGTRFTQRHPARFNLKHPNQAQNVPKEKQNEVEAESIESAYRGAGDRIPRLYAWWKHQHGGDVLKAPEHRLQSLSQTREGMMKTAKKTPRHWMAVYAEQCDRVPSTSHELTGGR